MVKKHLIEIKERRQQVNAGKTHATQNSHEKLDKEKNQNMRLLKSQHYEFAVRDSP